MTNFGTVPGPETAGPIDTTKGRRDLIETEISTKFHSNRFTWKASIVDHRKVRHPVEKRTERLNCFF